MDAPAPPTRTLDITAETCPMTFVRVKLELESMRSGEMLAVLMRGAEPLRNVPRSARAEGHAVVSLAERADAPGTHELLLRRK